MPTESQPVRDKHDDRGRHGAHSLTTQDQDGAECGSGDGPDGAGEARAEIGPQRGNPGDAHTKLSYEALPHQTKYGDRSNVAHQCLDDRARTEPLQGREGPQRLRPEVPVCCGETAGDQDAERTQTIEDPGSAMRSRPEKHPHVLGDRRLLHRSASIPTTRRTAPL